MQLYLIAATAFVAVANANPVALDARQATGGSGPYKPAKYSVDATLPKHTVYMPTGDTGSTKLPVLVWGNGGCSGDGASNSKLLLNIASYGYLAIASGEPGGKTSTTAALMTASIDWAVKNAGQGAYANVDATKIMAAGFSCGGVEANAQIWDSRVKTVGIVSSGLLQNTTAAKDFHKPIVYIIGGSGDVAYNNAERDYKALPTDTPVWKGNIPVGHGGTLFNADGGTFGKTLLNWLEWLFRGDKKAASYFTEGYKEDKWTVESRNLDKLTTPV